MSNGYLFRGAITELIAPLNAHEEIDYYLLKQQIHRQLELGIHGLFLSGLTECMVTSLQEQIDMLRFCVKEVNGAVPVMGSICTNRPSDARHMISAFEDAGADAISIVNPHTFTYEKSEVYDYFSELISAAKLPVYIYNAPQTNNILSPDLVHRLVAENKNVLGYKDSLQNIMHLQEVMMGIDPARHFEVLAGSDASIYATLTMGGCGVISWVTVLFPQLVQELCDAYFAGDVILAREKQFQVNRVRSALKLAPMDTGYRYISELLGVSIGQARRPMNPQATEEQKAMVLARLKELGMM